MIFDLNSLKVKLFADGANVDGMVEMAGKDYIKGLTTNPSIMRKAGITDYRLFAKEVLKKITDKPVSFEVFSDDLTEMKRQALEIASWGENVYVKIPITNSIGLPTVSIIEDLTAQGCRINVTAVFTLAQVSSVFPALKSDIPSYVSIFAGRIADTGRDPVPIIKKAQEMLSDLNSCEIIWASPRELLNVFQAEECGCHIITATNELLGKLSLIGKDLDDYSLDTVKMFANDAMKSGYIL